MLIGVISDTHGLLRPETLTALAGADHILHAGDVGDARILDTLRKIAPVTAIRGNIDQWGECAELPATDVVELDERLFYLVHSLTDLDINPSVAGIAAVISGHSHKPSIEQRNGVLYLNPGSAGPRRFNLPITIALMTVNEAGLETRLVNLL
ncbi:MULTISPECIES: metallophosphoesterase family protein [Acidobacteriaceae]|uniref:metallophosphoesterase family protein n=1 Tax=Acidobacteriaceae TaxID=204434 RepID=UPI00131E39DA|nr:MULTISPECIES: metallophosphoesterase family protein [Acidobacteriaceae]MDW5266897.1 metallophosphoesterase family protein [Edaphobacter sp.]